MERARAYEQEGGIDPFSNLLDGQVYVFFSIEDDAVTTEVVDQTVAFYHAIGLPETSIHYVDDRLAGHNVQT